MAQVEGAAPINYWKCADGGPHEWQYIKESQTYYCRKCVCLSSKLELKSKTDLGPKALVSTAAALDEAIAVAQAQGNRKLATALEALKSQ